MSVYTERHWMTDTPQGREWALTWDGERYMVRQWEPQAGGYWLPETHRQLHWRPLPPPPGGVDVSGWCAVEGEQ